MSDSDLEATGSSPYSMTEKILERRLHKKEYGLIWPQLFAGILTFLSSLSFGTTLGWSNPVSQNNKKSITGSDNGVILLVSIVLLGCSFGITLSTMILKQVGPKKALRILGAFYVFTWCIMLVPTLELQLAGRFFLGFLGIAYSICGEHLFAQTVHFRIRKFVSVLINSSMVLGVFLSHLSGMAHEDTIVLTAICASIAILHYILVQIVPESPVYLYATSHMDAAKSLKWYRGAGNFYEDMSNIKKDWDAMRQDPDAYRYMLYSKSVYKPLLVVVGVTICQVSSGYFVFMFYSIGVWSDEKIVLGEIFDTLVLSGCYVLTKLFWGTFHTMFHTKVRILLIISCLLGAVNLTLLAIYLYLQAINPKEQYWIPLLILCMHLFFLDMGLNHFPKILIFEYMPFQMFRRALLLVNSLFWFLNFLNIFAFGCLLDELENYIYFFIMAGVLYVGSLFCYFCVVETKDKSLVQIQIAFGGNPVGRRGAIYNQTKETV